MTRTHVARGIYRDAYGYEVRWREQGRTRSKHFPLDTPDAALVKWRDTKERTATKQRALHTGGSFPRDAVRFLASRKGRPGFRSDRAHLRVWIHRFTKLSRYAISRDMIQMTIATWQRAGYSPQELRHRWRILRQCLAHLNGPDVPNPCVGVTLPKIPKARPRSVSDTLVRDVALQLRRQEILRRLHDAKTRARFLVDATCGQRPIQAQRAQPSDVDLEQRIWFVTPAKGDAGATVYLNDDMYAAWGLFIAARAWGPYNRRSYVRTLQRNGWPKGIRPYNLRHTVGLSLSELGVDLGDIQAHMGHTSPETTRIYVPGLLGRLKDASDRLDGRLMVDAAVLPHRTTTPDKNQKAKERENTNKIGDGAVQSKRPLSRLQSSKTA